jgi:hypothetical protein
MSLLVSFYSCNTEGAIKNGQSRDSGNIVRKTQDEDKQNKAKAKTKENTKS